MTSGTMASDASTMSSRVIVCSSSTVTRHVGSTPPQKEAEEVAMSSLRSYHHSAKRFSCEVRDSSTEE